MVARRKGACVFMCSQESELLESPPQKCKGSWGEEGREVTTHELRKWASCWSSMPEVTFN